ncbi:MAG: aspartyl beta-hydroxylase [Alphaproteobacteria bacterium HGW-Alphaproteobacteria-18]|nr:MAG: aspartyl beta-hydroxylase [Alphaproteobacteria bacterium HGW-Alphaproteobacteria-18]
MRAPSSPSGILLSEIAIAMQRGDMATALAISAEAERQFPRDPEVGMAKAVLLRVTGNLVQSIAALDEVLSIDPYHFFALLSKGSLVERLSGPKAAARIYRDALKIAPPEETMPPNLKGPTDHARHIVSMDQLALAEFLTARIAGVADQHPGAATFRFGESVDIMLGRKKPFAQEPLFFHYPQLPAITFYPRELFGWLPELEAATSTILSELEHAQRNIADDFKPYIQYPDHAPVNQWAELNQSARWSTFFLWKDGERQQEACDMFPATVSLLDALPLAHQSGFAPTVMFSKLDPHTVIPPHTGSTNIRLIAHLPLILPGPASFRVGNETREWKMGEAWVFDDTIEHEARNDANEARTILIFDVWNPFLSEGERALITELMTARNEYYSS